MSVGQIIGFSTMKAKEAKILRKKLAFAERTCSDPLDLIPKSLLDPLEERNYVLSTQRQLDDFLDLFHRNMGDMYRNSSWGLDLQDKENEMEHHKAKYLVVKDCDEAMLGFIHYRVEYTDDNDAIAMYVYELQIEERAQRQGIGRRLMKAMEYIAKAAQLDRILLTVFKSNTAALDFYTKSLMYVTDESNPPDEDYVILVRILDST